MLGVALPPVADEAAEEVAGHAGGAADPLLDQLVALADSGVVDLVAKGIRGGLARGWFYDRDQDLFLSDRNGESVTPADLRAGAAVGSEITFTVVPLGTGRRLGIDRDGDRFGDRTESDQGTDATSAADFPQ